MSDYFRVESPSAIRLDEILAYAVPGAAAVGLVYVFEVWVRAIVPDAIDLHLPVTTLLIKLYDGVPPKAWLLQGVFTVGLVLGVYIVGHLIASVSSFLIDRGLIYKGYGYPYSFLLNTTKTDPDWLAVSAAYYKGTFFWLNTLILAVFLATCAGLLKHHVASLVLVVLTGVLLLINLAVLLLKIFLGMIRSERAGWPNSWAKGPKGRQLAADVGRPVILKLAALYELITELLAKLLNTRRSFDRDFVDAYRTIFRRLFHTDSRTAESNNFWFSYLYLKEHAKETYSLIDKYDLLGTFARNLSTGFYLAFIYMVGWLVVSRRHLACVHNNSLEVLFLGIVLTFVAACALLIRYYYLYVAYFSKTLYRALVVHGSRVGGKV